MRVNKLRRKTYVDDGEEGDGEEEEEEEQGKVVGTKRKLAGRKQAQTLRKRISVQDRLKEFPKQTLEVKGRNLVCQACNKTLDWGKKSSVKQHCNGDTHRMAVTDHERKKDGKQVNNRKNISFFFNFQISFFYLEKERSAGCILVW